MDAKTQFRGSGPVIPPQELKCPSCRLPTQGRPFCAHDGTLIERPFVVAGRYVMNDVLGAGGTALVFGGHDKVLGRPVALKVLRPQLAHDAVEAQRFLRAARLGSQLQHENIVVVHDCGEDRELGLVYLVMERLLGGTLADLRSQNKQLPWKRSVQILVQICRALTESHRLGILHRDLGLRNVTLTTTSGRSDVVKLCDFGLACSSAGDDRITSTGTAVGTPAYMAPEQIRGDEAQDHRIDLYGFGVIAYEMVSGRLPHEAATTVAMIASKLTAPAMPLSERCPDLQLPAGLEPLIMRCLASEPSARPESAAEIERELLALGDAAPTMPRPGVDLVGQCIGHYRVLRRLNQGGMGEVYIVEHDVIGTKAALKVLLPEIASNPEAIDRFIQEARASGEIGSEHIARCYDFGYLPDKRAYVLMELVEGESVATVIAQRGPLPLADVKQIVQQTTGALAAAHAIGIIHRDIKPDHIMLCRRPNGFHVKLLDFGIAKVFTSNASHTQVGMFMGTPLYCAPEQVLGEPVSPATDIYALGASIYEMLTGRPPFSGDSGHVLAIKTQRDPVSISELRPTVPRAVAKTVAWMMARDRAERPMSMRDVTAQVAAWPEREHDVTVAHRKPGALWLGRSRLILASVAACVVLALIVALWPRSDARPAAVEAPIPSPAPAKPITVTPIAPTVPSAPPSISPSQAAAPTPSPSPIDRPVPTSMPSVSPITQPVPTAQTAMTPPVETPSRPKRIRSNASVVRDLRTAQPTKQPAAAQPTKQPAAAQPTKQPTVPQPTTKQPTLAQPTKQPTVVQPTTKQPTLAQPTKQPTAAPPATKQPSAKRKGQIVDPFKADVQIVDPFK